MIMKIKRKNNFKSLNKTPIQNIKNDSNIKYRDYSNSKSASKLNFTPKKLSDEYNLPNKADYKTNLQNPYATNDTSGEILFYINSDLSFKYWYFIGEQAHETKNRNQKPSKFRNRELNISNNYNNLKYYTKL